MTNTYVKAEVCHKLLTNFTLGDDRMTLKSSYYKDYVECGGKRSKFIKPEIAVPPPCATIYSPEQFPFAHVATTTQRRDFSNRGQSISSGAFQDRIHDLNTIKTIHMHNSVVFGPNSGQNPYESVAMADYRHPVETARNLIKKWDTF